MDSCLNDLQMAPGWPSPIFIVCPHNRQSLPQLVFLFVFFFNFFNDPNRLIEIENLLLTLEKMELEMKSVSETNLVQSIKVGWVFWKANPKWQSPHCQTLFPSLISFSFHASLVNASLSSVNQLMLGQKEPQFPQSSFKGTNPNVVSV